MDIGEVAKQSNLPTSTLRYYEEQGLIKSIGRNGLRRQYKPSVVEQLSLISLGRLAGLSLDEIGAMFDGHGKAKIDRQQLANKADEIDQTIKELTAMRDGLRHAAQCPASNHFECEKFCKLLRIANRHIRKTK
ncbi:helix-turn-helix domain-containing protein [Marinifaba aquimaris]|uniref:helix-turn-helix domain-containing protein n=1 Tax=Marinifaba aquimaris TaxID=2741323 RepID=UPI0031B5E7DE